MHSSHRDWFGKQASLRAVAISGGVNACLYFNLILVWGLSWEQGAKILNRRWVLRAERHLRIGKPWWFHAVLDLGPWGKAPEALVGRRERAWHKRHLSIYVLFRQVGLCLGKKIKPVSPLPSPKSLGSRLYSTGTSVSSSCLIHSFMNLFSQCYWTQIYAKNCAPVHKRLWLVDSKSFCDTLGKTLLPNEVTFW